MQNEQGGCSHLHLWHLVNAIMSMVTMSFASCLLTCCSKCFSTESQHRKHACWHKTAKASGYCQLTFQGISGLIKTLLQCHQAFFTTGDAGHRGNVPKLWHVTHRMWRLASEPETKCAVRAVRVQKRLDVTLGAVHTRELRGNTCNLLFLFTSAP